MPESSPGSTQSPDFYAAAYAAAQTPEEQQALFYQMLGDYGQARADAAAAFELAADAVATVTVATTAEITTEDPEIEELRARVAELVGELSAAETTNKKLGVAKVSAEDRANQAEADAQRIHDFTKRTIQRLTGKVRILEGHVCTVQDVKDLHFVGVVGTARVYAHNSVRRQVMNLFAIRQGTDEQGLDCVVIRHRTFKTNNLDEVVSLLTDSQTDPEQ